MGFLLFLPFLVIDLVVSSVLLSMGMFMLPPVMISTPFKILLFVLVDGWHLVCQSLVTSFVAGEHVNPLDLQIVDLARDLLLTTISSRGRSCSSGSSSASRSACSRR
jgi:hypothetical protein